jgi:hypothetical protein
LVDNLAPEGVPDVAQDSSPRYLTVYKNALYFTALTGSPRLYRYDGVSAPAQVTFPVVPGQALTGTAVSNLVVLGDTLYFSAYAGPLVIQQLWKYDGVSLPQVATPLGQAIDPSLPIALNGALYFTATTVFDGFPDFWKYDGTTVSVLSSQRSNPYPLYLFAWDNSLFFTVHPLLTGDKELWRLWFPQPGVWRDSASLICRLLLRLGPLPVLVR